VSGIACNVTDVPIPSLTCTDIAAKTNSCSQCIETSISLLLSCSWCVNGTNSTAGTCTSNGACPSNITYAVCPTIINFIPEVCPDGCSGHGTCVNASEPGYASALASQQGSITGLKVNSSLCLCVSGFSGLNCGQYPPPDNSIIYLAAGIGTGAIVGIVLAAVLIFVGCGGGGAFAYSQLSTGGNAPVIANNPLFQEQGLKGENPLLRH